MCSNDTQCTSALYMRWSDVTDASTTPRRHVGGTVTECWLIMQKSDNSYATVILRPSISTGALFHRQQFADIYASLLQHCIPPAWRWNCCRQLRHYHPMYTNITSILCISTNEARTDWSVWVSVVISWFHINQYKIHQYIGRCTYMHMYLLPFVVNKRWIYTSVKSMEKGTVVLSEQVQATHCVYHTITARYIYACVMTYCIFMLWSWFLGFFSVSFVFVLLFFLILCVSIAEYDLFIFEASFRRSECRSAS